MMPAIGGHARDRVVKRRFHGVRVVALAPSVWLAAGIAVFAYHAADPA